MLDPKIFLGLPINFQNICKIYPPKVQEIVENDEIMFYYKILTQTKDDVTDFFYEEAKNKDKPPDIDPFDFLLINCYQSKEYYKQIQRAFYQFTHQYCLLDFQSRDILLSEIQFNKVTDLSTIKKINIDNFFDFQNLIRESMGNKKEEKPKEETNSFVAKVKAAGRKRERLAAKNKKGISFTTNLAAICCMGIGITPLNIGEITYAAINILMNFMQAKEKYDGDIKSILAGADPKKIKPKYWISDSVINPDDYKKIDI